MWILSEGYPCLGFTVWIKIYQVQKSRILGHDNVWSSLSVWHTTPQDWLENKPIASHFGFALRKLGLGTDHVIPVMSPFTKSSVYKMFSVYIMLKRKAGFFKFLAFEGRCRKAPFSWRISEDGRPNRRNTAALENFSATLQLSLDTRHAFFFFHEYLNQFWFHFFRSHTFAVRSRSSDLQGVKIHNLNVRGKRGNIVQVYPGVEYDFVPNSMFVKDSDYIHFQYVTFYILFII